MREYLRWGYNLEGTVYRGVGKLGPGEWAVISARCGAPWQTTTNPRPGLEGIEASRSMPGYYPPDLPIL